MDATFLGFGLGLRGEHFQEVLEDPPEIVDWFEIISENFMVEGGKPKYFLHAIRERYPMVMHGVSLSIGSVDPLDMSYLKKLKKLADEIDAPWVSDHLCFTGADSTNTHDLLPLPYDPSVIQHVGKRIKEVQDYLERPFLLENVSSYLDYKASMMTEWEFLSEVVEYADCQLLLDINNIFVSARNQSFDPKEYLDYIDPKRVKQFHLAGHTDNGTHIIDTHDHPVVEGVWSLYRQALRRFGPISTMIERDDNIPELKELLRELSIAKNIAEEELDTLEPA